MNIFKRKILSRLFRLRGKKKADPDPFFGRRVIHPGISVKGEEGVGEIHDHELVPSGEFYDRVNPEALRERDADLDFEMRRRGQIERFEKIRKYFDEHQEGDENDDAL
jgi:hypothetical protein